MTRVSQCKVHWDFFVFGIFFCKILKSDLCNIKGVNTKIPLLFKQKIDKNYTKIFQRKNLYDIILVSNCEITVSELF